MCLRLRWRRLIAHALELHSLKRTRTRELTLRGEGRCAHVANSAIEQSHQRWSVLSIDASAEGILEPGIHQTIISLGNMPAGLVDTLKLVDRAAICLIQNRVDSRRARQQLTKINDCLTQVRLRRRLTGGAGRALQLLPPRRTH